MSLLHNSFVILVCTASMLDAFTTAKEYFDAGAQTYIIKNDTKNAKLILQEGITAFPDDEQLKKLAGKIKEEENKKNQKDQNKNDQNQDKQDQKDQQQQDKKEDQSKQDQNKDQQQKQDEQKQEQESQQDPKDQKEQQMKQSEMKEEQDLKKDEAKRIIEMYADDADTLNKPMTKQKAAGARQPLQDW